MCMYHKSRFFKVANREVGLSSYHVYILLPLTPSLTWCCPIVDISVVFQRLHKLRSYVEKHPPPKLAPAALLDGSQPSDALHEARCFVYYSLARFYDVVSNTRLRYAWCHSSFLSLPLWLCWSAITLHTTVGWTVLFLWQSCSLWLCIFDRLVYCVTLFRLL